MYELSPSHYLRAGAVATVLAVALGMAAALVLPFGRGIPFLGLMIAVLLGGAAGAAMSEGITRATKGKRGLGMQLIAGAGLVGSWVIYMALSGGLVPLRLELIGLFTMVVAVVATAQRLR
jgi:hypothetical protein